MKGATKLGVQRGTNEHELLETRKAEEKLKYELRYYDSAPPGRRRYAERPYRSHRHGQRSR